MMTNETQCSVDYKQATGEVYQLECKQFQINNIVGIKRENDGVSAKDNEGEFEVNNMVQIKRENEEEFEINDIIEIKKENEEEFEINDIIEIKKENEEDNEEEFEINDMEEIKKENVGGNEEYNVEENYINIKEEKEDSNQEENVDIIDVESGPPSGQNMPIKKTLVTTSVIILKKTAIGTSVNKRTLNKAPQKVKQIKLEEAADHRETLTNAASTLPNNNCEVSDTSYSQNLYVDLKNVTSKSKQIINSTVNCYRVNKISRKVNILRKRNKHNIQITNTIEENNKKLSSNMSYSNVKNESCKFLPKSTGVAATSTLLDESNEGSKSNVCNEKESEKRFTCHICPYKCCTKSALNTHLRIHTGEKPYICDFCDYRCTQKGTLTYHVKYKHTKEMKFSCNICQFKCLTKSTLNVHLRTHTGEKPYACDFCDFRSSQKSYISTHIKIKHIVEKGFACHLCPFKCAEKNNLRSHLYKHTGEKPYICDLCDFRCARKGNLVNHIKVKHMKEKNFTCHICQYKCYQKTVLDVHLHTHTKGQPHECEVCDYKCAFSAILNSQRIKNA